MFLSSGRCRRIAIREDVIERQIDGALVRIAILPEFGEWGRQELEQWRRRELIVTDAVHRQQGETIVAIDQQLDSLLTLKLKELGTDEEYAERKAKLRNERSLLHRQAQEADEADALAQKAVENVVAFTGNVRAWFAGGDIATRRAIARALGSNYRFTEGKVEIELHPLLQPVEEEYQQLEAKYRKIKLSENSSESQEEQALEPLRPAWSRLLDNIRLLALNNSLSFPNVQEVVDAPADLLAGQETLQEQGL